MIQTALLAIRLYRRLVSPLLPPACRYWPSCSEYAEEAFYRHGSWPGLRLTVRRLLKCHPWGGHGVDLVPPAPARDA